MRVAIIGDIHGNADALDAVLRDVQRHGADMLVVNGDVVNRGPDSVQVMERVLAWPGARFTLGNHDDLLRLWQARSDTLPAAWFGDPFWGATAWSAAQLEQAGLLHVPGAWPRTVDLEVSGLPRVRIAHGTAHHYREGLSERTPPERIAALRGHGDMEAAVLVGSHIHRPAHATVDGTLVVNTGAVGFPATGDPRAQYVILSVDTGRWTPDFRAVEYDRRGVLSRFRSSGLLATGLSAEIFHEELQSARSLYTPYWDWTERGAVARTPASWAQFLARRRDPRP